MTEKRDWLVEFEYNVSQDVVNTKMYQVSAYEKEDAIVCAKLEIIKEFGIAYGRHLIANNMRNIRALDIVQFLQNGL